MSILIYARREIEGLPERVDDEGSKVHRVTRPLNIMWTVEREWSAEAGNMAILGKSSFSCLRHCTEPQVCGHPRFDRHVRKAVRASQYDAVLFQSSFQPDETPESKIAWSQFLREGSGRRGRPTRRAST